MCFIIIKSSSSALSILKIARIQIIKDFHTGKRHLEIIIGQDKLFNKFSIENKHK